MIVLTKISTKFIIYLFILTHSLTAVDRASSNRLQDPSSHLCPVPHPPGHALHSDRLSSPHTYCRVIVDDLSSSSHVPGHTAHISGAWSVDPFLGCGPDIVAVLSQQCTKEAICAPDLTRLRWLLCLTILCLA